MINKISCVLLLAATLLCTISQAQDAVDKLIPKTIMASPNVAGLGKYGDYGVSFYTGLPEISIPIFEVKSGSLTVPVTLSYHASGIRYTDQASWVGLGFSLSAGGQISRSSQGSPDEDLYSNSPLPFISNICNNYTGTQQMADGQIDPEPDIFSYSYPGGKGGKFMLPPGGTGAAPYIFPYEPIIIAPQFVGFHIPKFEITGEDGNFYRFGVNASGTTAVEDTNSANGGVSKTARTAWYLMDMIAPNSDDKIAFSYQNIGTSVTTDINQSVTINDQFDVVGCPPSTPPVTVWNNDKVSSSTIGAALGLSTIIFEGGKVEFILAGANRNDQSSKALDQINIYSQVNGVYTLLKSVKFVYSYFGSNLRLKLDQVLFLDAAGQTVQQYGFTYFTNTFSWNLSNNSFRRDYWGYYNGAINASLIPQTTVEFQPTIQSLISTLVVGDANRDTNPNLYYNEGLIQRLDLPTGGYTNFEFEPHRYQDAGVTKYTGGVRVTKITSSDGTGAPPLVKTYKYGVGESGFGVANFTLGRYFFVVENMISTHDAAECPSNPGAPAMDYSLTYRSRTYLSSSSLDLGANEGSPVVYPNVTEYYGDNVSNIGKIVYEYDNGSYTPDIFISNTHGSRFYKNTQYWKRGNLTKKLTYDASLNLLTESRTSYSSFHDGAVYVGAASNAYHSHAGAQLTGSYSCNDENNIPRYGDEYVVTNYQQGTGAMRQSSTVEYQYESGNTARYVRKQSDQTYDADKLQVTYSKVNKSSSPEETVSIMKYPFSYGTISASATGSAKALRTLQLKNDLSTPVETYHYIQNSDGTNQRVVSGQLTAFKENPVNTSFVVADQIYLMETNTPVPLASYVPSSINGTSTGVTMDTRYKSRINFTNYDIYGNLLDLARTNDKSTAYVWGYTNTMPIAEATNTTASFIKHTSFEDDGILNAEVKTGKKVWNGVYTLLLPSQNGIYLVSYWQKPSGIGVGAWQYIEQSITVSTGGSSTAIGAAGNIIDEVRVLPATAMMTTYTYDPVLGETTITDQNNKTAYYSYDSFGRLLFIKDDNGKILKSYGYHYNGTQP